MQRIIEEFIENRKKSQVKLKDTINKLGEVFKVGIFRKKKKDRVEGLLLDFNDNINELILNYNKEWDSYSNNHMSGVLEALNNKILKLEADYTNAKSLLNNFIDIENGLQELIENIDEKNIKNDDKMKLNEYKEALSLYQYSNFEKRFRGEQDNIKEKLKKYFTYFKDSDEILDIGCGRGEFIEILEEKNKKGMGIDISKSMLKIAKSKGLDCKYADALDFLKGKADNSIGGIFSSQVIEHFTPDYLREVILESFRTLKSGSTIILETVNPLSIFALSRIFFLDVTHQKPLHPEYMRYLLESSGFYDVDIIYSEGDLQDEKLETISPENGIARTFNTNVDKINNMLYSSVEYAVRGIKK